MFNLLVSGADDAWDGRPFELDLERAVREYTAPALTKKYGTFSPEATKELLLFPTLFSHEQHHKKDARIGWITGLKTRERKVRIEYAFEPLAPSIPIATLKELEWDMDIGEWELNRTHWAVKEGDLVTILTKAGLLKKGQIRNRPKKSNTRTRPSTLEAGLQFEVAPTVFRVPQSGQTLGLVSVMMPFDGQFKEVYSAIKEACKKIGATCQRADDIWEDSVVMQDVFSLIYRSQVVISDLSGRNANVFYETGIAHTLGRPVVPILQDKKDVPFDLGHHRYLEYTTTPDGLKTLAEKLIPRLATLTKK